MVHVSYDGKNILSRDKRGKPIVTIKVWQNRGNDWNTDVIYDMLIDTGADITTLNKAYADENKLPILVSNGFTILGFGDLGKLYRELARRLESEVAASEYFQMFTGSTDELVATLENDFGITGIGTPCDIREISRISIEIPPDILTLSEVRVATPHSAGVVISQVLGVNVLEKFDIGLNFSNDQLYLSKSTAATSNVDSRYACGSVMVSLSTNTSFHSNKAPSKNPFDKPSRPRINPDASISDV